MKENQKQSYGKYNQIIIVCESLLEHQTIQNTFDNAPVPPLSTLDTFQDPQWMPETVHSIKPCMLLCDCNFPDT
jgi:hypothetical protein